MSEKAQSTVEMSGSRFAGVCKNILREVKIEIQPNFKLVQIDMLKPPSGEDEEQIISNQEWNGRLANKGKNLEMWPNLSGEKKLFAIRNGNNLFWMNFGDYGPKGDIEDKGFGISGYISGQSSARRNESGPIPGTFHGELPTLVQNLFELRALKALDVDSKRLDKSIEGRVIDIRRVGLAEGATGSRISRAMDKLASIIRIPDFPFQTMKAGEGQVELIAIGEIQEQDSN